MYPVQKAEHAQSAERSDNVQGDSAGEVHGCQEGIRESPIDLGAMLYPDGIGRTEGYS